MKEGVCTQQSVAWRSRHGGREAVSSRGLVVMLEGGFLAGVTWGQEAKSGTRRRGSTAPMIGVEGREGEDGRSKYQRESVRGEK